MIPSSYEYLYKVFPPKSAFQLSLPPVLYERIFESKIASIAFDSVKMQPPGNTLSNTIFDICLFVLDASKEAEEEDREVLSLFETGDVITIENKCDLDRKLIFETPFKTLRISTKTGEGIDELVSILEEKLGQNNTENEVVITNERQKKALVEALDAIVRAKNAFFEGMPSDLIFIDLETALAALGEITGENVSDDVIDTIFSRFCVGK